jgi:hypothetical protein
MTNGMMERYTDPADLGKMIADLRKRIDELERTSVSAGAVNWSGAQKITAGGVNDRGLVIVGANGQVVPLQEWRDSTDVVKASLAATATLSKLTVQSTSTNQASAVYAASIEALANPDFFVSGGVSSNNWASQLKANQLSQGVTPSIAYTGVGASGATRTPIQIVNLERGVPVYYRLNVTIMGGATGVTVAMEPIGSPSVFTLYTQNAVGDSGWKRYTAWSDEGLQYLILKTTGATDATFSASLQVAVGGRRLHGGDAIYGGSSWFSPALGSIAPTAGPTVQIDGVTGVITATTLQAAVAFPVTPSFRNVIRNGDFSIAQRGNGPFVAPQGYTVDGLISTGAGGSRQITRLPIGVTGFGADINGAAWHVESNVSGQATGGDYHTLQVRAESVRKFANKTVTLSFIAQGSAGVTKIGVSREQYFGVGGSATVAAGVATIPITTSATKYYVTFAVPGISTKTIGSGDLLNIVLWLSAGTSFSATTGIGIQNGLCYITDIQLEEGPIATPFERLHMQAQLAWCQRYFWRHTPSGGSHTIGTGYCYSASGAGIPYRYPVPMRVPPTARVVGTPTNWAILNNAGGGIGLVTLTWSASGDDVGSSLGATVTAGLVAGDATALYANVLGASTYLEASAEL